MCSISIQKQTLIRLLTLRLHGIKTASKRLISQVSDEAQRQRDLFNLEKIRQKEALGRVEKIEVICEEPLENVTLVMNRSLSTPFDCAKHLGDTVAGRSALALLNGETLWHMHKPLPESCKLQFLHYNIPQPNLVNKAFWRTCSFLLGSVISNAFKDDISCQLHSFPSPNIRTGSFVYDAQLSLDDWKPTESELRVLSTELIKFCQQNHNIRCLDVTTDFASTMFKNNPHKTKQIPNIAANNGGKITLFKVGHHVDISKGPMITNTNHLGRITITNVFKLNTDLPSGQPIYRFQGVALPRSIVINHFAYNILENRAKKMNPARIPSLQQINEEDGFIKPVVA